MTKCRRFHGAEVRRLIVSVPLAMVAAVDGLLTHSKRHRRCCRAEFVRLAIAEKLAREAVTGPAITNPGSVRIRDQAR